MRGRRPVFLRELPNGETTMILPMLNESIAASHRDGVSEEAAILAAGARLKGYKLTPGERETALDHIRRVAAKTYRPTVIPEPSVGEEVLAEDVS